MRILLIEDHQEIGQNVKEYCEAEGWEVDWYTTMQQVKERIGKQYRDCVVLDRMLPDGDGNELLQYIRAKSDLPVIMSTALGALDEKGSSYTQGADDYLVKPYALAELVMRIRAIVSRSQESDVVILGDCTIYLDENRIVVGDQETHVTTKEWIILTELLDAKGKIVERTQLIEAVWGDDQMWEHDGALDVYIANLRKKLGKEKIETVKGVGYKVIFSTDEDD